MFKNSTHNGIFDYFDKHGFFDGAYYENAEWMRDEVLMELNMALAMKGSRYRAHKCDVLTHHNGCRIIFIHLDTGDRVEDPNTVDELKKLVEITNQKFIE